MSIFDAKGTASGKSVYKVTNVRREAGGTVSDFTNTFYDKSNKQVTSGTGHFKCTGNGVSIDMNFQMKMMGQGIPMKLSAVEWFAQDFGPVKTLSSKDGKDMGGTMITALKK